MANNKTYITVMQSPRCHQMTLEEFLFNTEVTPQYNNDGVITGTRTYEVETVSQVFEKRFNVSIAGLIDKLKEFNEATKQLRDVPRESLYREFHIPKKSGGLRKIDAPNDNLMTALRRLKDIFENDFHALYHTSAFAYIRNRSTIDAVKKHQTNESKWFAKYDLSDFFGSTTQEFVIKMFSMVFPFSEVLKDNDGYEAFKTAIDLAFLNGGLPQGTPISPIITNIMMIPIDFRISNDLRSYNRQHYIYTRYADDFLISSKYTFKFKEIEKYIVDVLKEFEAPFTIKEKKTRYGSSAGSNWNLGVMLNKDNNITVGYKKKRQFQAMLSSYVMDRKNGVVWDKSDIQTMEGYRNYYKMVEGDSIDRIVNHIGNKFGVDIVKMIKEDLKPRTNPVHRM